MAVFEWCKRVVVDRLGINRVADHADRLDAEIVALRAVRDDLVGEVERLRSDVADLGPAATWARINTMTAWSAAVPLRREPTISIVMATRNRAGLLRQAIDSVVAQSYPYWQLVIVDDGSTDDTPVVLAELGDDRIITSRTNGLGAAAARNQGLALATGDYVAFLDDDNAMAPGWLRAVAEYTGRRPECELLYGAQIREVEPGEERPPNGRPTDRLWVLFIDPFDADRLTDHNYVDLGAIVVRHGHPELRFDEELDIFIDWELFIRLSQATPPHPVPVIASLYRTGAPDRITSSAHREERLDAMRRRFASVHER